MEGGVIGVELGGGYSGFCCVVIACRERCCGSCGAGFFRCSSWLGVRRGVMFVPLCVYQVIV